MADTSTTTAVARVQPTAGPLHLKRARIGGDVTIFTAKHGIVGEFYESIDHSFEARGDEAMANARLFLSAPRMLALLRKAVAAVDEPSDIGTLPDLMKVAAEARSLLAEYFEEAVL